MCYTLDGENMKCPRCKCKMIDGVCIKCGYMKSGNKISVSYDDKKSDLEIYEKDYDDMIHNRKLWKPYLLGTFYIGYKGHVITGVLLSFIEVVCFYYVYRFFESFAMWYQFVFGLFMSLTLWIFVRLILAGVLNSFILYLDKRSIKKIIKVNSKNYKFILASHRSNSSFLLFLNIIFCLWFFVIFMILISYF